MTEHNVKYPCCGQPVRVQVDAVGVKRRKANPVYQCPDCRKKYTVAHNGWNRLTWVEKAQ